MTTRNTIAILPAQHELFTAVQLADLSQSEFVDADISACIDFLVRFPEFAVAANAEFAHPTWKTQAEQLEYFRRRNERYVELNTLHAKATGIATITARAFGIGQGFTAAIFTGANLSVRYFSSPAGRRCKLPALLWPYCVNDGQLSVTSVEMSLAAPTEHGELIFADEDFETLRTMAAAIETIKKFMAARQGRRSNDEQKALDMITVFHRGNNSYSLGQAAPQVVRTSIAVVLEAFAKYQCALKTRQLADLEIGNVSRIMKTINQIFPRAVTFPKSNGTGYFIRVK